MSLIQLIFTFMAFILAFVYPSKTNDKKFFSLNQQVSIKTNKNLPPYVAYEAINFNKIAANKNDLNKKRFPTSEIANGKIKREIFLSTETVNKTPANSEMFFERSARKLVLNTIRIFKTPQELKLKPIQLASVSVNAEEDLISNNIKSTEKKAQFELPTTQNPWAEELKSILNQKDQNAQLSEKSLSSGEKVIGYLQINDGLPITNEHHIEIKRIEEGVFKEAGTVNLIQGTYAVTPSTNKGFITAQLVDNAGKILGEGSVRLADVQWNTTGVHKGPKLNINKKVDIFGKIVSAYGTSARSALSQRASAHFFRNNLSKGIEKNGFVKMESVVPDSPTVMEVESLEHVSSQQIIIANHEFASTIYPEKMIKALKEIISEQRKTNYNDPNLSVIIGQVLLDQKPVSGVKVEVENFEYLEPVYFNALMLPDNNLKLTSENGYYAIIGAPDDLHQIRANKGNKYFGHNNAQVSAGVVSSVNIESSVKTEQVDIKVFDAFSGSAESAELIVQSLPENLMVNNGIQRVFLPSVSRLSFVHAKPAEKYYSANYSFIDKTDFIHIPLISKEWVYKTIVENKIPAYSTKGMVIGFVHDESFQVELPGINKAKNKIYYFDYNGKVIPNAIRGVQGGGFLVVNLDTATHEILVIGEESESIYSRIAPISGSDLYIFNFKR